MIIFDDPKFIMSSSCDEKELAHHWLKYSGTKILEKNYYWKHIQTLRTGRAHVIMS